MLYPIPDESLSSMMVIFPVTYFYSGNTIKFNFLKYSVFYDSDTLIKLGLS